MYQDRILYTDDHLLVVNKLAGELTVAAGGAASSGKSVGGRSFAPKRTHQDSKQPFFDFLKREHPGLKVVHRLDFGTSGVLVFAKSAAAVANIRESKFGGWKKTYRAIVAGDIVRPAGTIRAQLKARTHEGMVDALTEYKTLARTPVCSDVEAIIATGRKHQIRQHFAGIGHPLVLDPLYGNPKKDRAFRRAYRYRRFLLHAWKLSFPHPVTGKQIEVEAPLPKPFQEVADGMRAV